AAMFFLLACSSSTHHLVMASDTSATRQQYLRVPMAFEPNAGQSHTDAGFLARGPGYTILLNPTRARFSLRAKKSSAAQLVGMSIVGGNPAAIAEPGARQVGVSNYFRG